MSALPILTATGLSKTFLGFHAVKNVNLSVQRGTIHALLGPNGAGKSTCFNLLTRVISASSGEIMLNGQEITRTSPAMISQMGMARSFQISSIFDRLTVFENVMVAVQRRLRGNSFNFWRNPRNDPEIVSETERVLLKLQFKNGWDVRAGLLPYGQKRVLEMGVALASDPKIILLDEPMAGMNEADIDYVSQMIKGLTPDITVLFVEHNMDVVSSIADTVTVMARGEVIAEGSYDQVSNNSEVIEAYIGA